MKYRVVTLINLKTSISQVVDRDEIPTNFGTNDDFLSNVNLNSLLDNLSDVAHTATESRDLEDALESPLLHNKWLSLQFQW